jgi:hypothetical protein
MTGKIQSDDNIVNESQDSVQLTDEEMSEMSDMLTNIIKVEMSLTFPMGVTGVTGISKNSYRLDGNTITLSLTSGTSDKSFTVTGGLREATYKKFPSVRTYDNRFKDVPTSAWYRDQLVSAYEIGIISGTSDTTFSPNAYLTLAQVTVMASRMRSLYENDGETFKKANSSDAWYKPYVDYAVKKGILNNSKEFSDYTRAATRAEMAHIFAKCLPSSVYQPVKAPVVFTDVPTTHKYYSDIMTLQASGVVSGTSATYFSASSNVTRAQTAVIVARIAALTDNQ